VKTVKLREISELKTGPFGTQFSANEYVSEGIPVINVKNIGYGNIISEGLDYVGTSTLERLSEHKLKTGDIVFGRKGSVDRHCLITKEQDGWMQGSDCIRVRMTDASVHSNFISYYLLTDAVKAKINNSAVGSTMASLNTDILGDIDIRLPSCEEQYKIATVLSTIDHKIETNNKINDYLEEMAKTIYDYWFVQFDFPDENGKPYKSSGGALLYNEVLKKEIPFGWTIDTLGNLLSKVPNSTKIPSTDFYDKGSIPVIDQSSDFIAGYTDDETSLLYNKTGYIVFGDHTRVVKYIRFPFARGADGTQVINSNNRCMPNELFYQVIKSIDLSNYGYARHFKYLKDTIIAIPSAKLANIYAEKVGKLYENQVSIMKENNALSQLRDWLLPMLMNGQATIED
jgi:type I restriction enzyme S subunit